MKLREEHNKVYLYKTIKKLQYIFDNYKNIKFTFKKYNNYYDDRFRFFINDLSYFGFFSDVTIETCFRDYLNYCIDTLTDDDVNFICDSIEYGNCHYPDEPCFKDSVDKYLKSFDNIDLNDFFGQYKENLDLEKEDYLIRIADSNYEYINELVDDDCIEEDYDD